MMTKQPMNVLLQTPAVKANSLSQVTTSKNADSKHIENAANDFKAFLKLQMQSKEQASSSQHQLQKNVAAEQSQPSKAQQKTKENKSDEKAKSVELGSKSDKSASESTSLEKSDESSVLHPEKALQELTLLESLSEENVLLINKEREGSLVTSSNAEEIVGITQDPNAMQLNGFLQTPSQIATIQIESRVQGFNKADLLQQDLVSTQDLQQNLKFTPSNTQTEIDLKGQAGELASSANQVNLSQGTLDTKSISASAFLQAMREVDLQTVSLQNTSIDKTSIQLTNPATQVGLAELNMKGFSSIVSMSSVQTPFGQTAWHQEIQQKVVWMASGGIEAATLTLNPPELGPLKVVIQVNQQKADTLFISDNPEVRAALKENMEFLREAMRGSAITLGQADVNAGDQQQFQQQLSQGRGDADNTSAHKVQNTSEVVIDAKSKPARTLAHHGLVNTFA